MNLELVLAIGSLGPIAIVAAIFGAEKALQQVFRRWDAGKGVRYDTVQLHLWDRNDRPAYREFKKFATTKQIYYQDFVGYMHFPFEGKYFNINSHGFRSREIPLRNLDGRYRVLMLGASALEGVPNCADDETISHHLQAALDDSGGCVEVINAGVRSYTIKNELNMLYRLQDVMDFDAIIVYDGFADISFAGVGNLHNGYPRVTNYVQAAWNALMAGDEDWFLSQAKTLRSTRRLASIGQYLPNLLRVWNWLQWSPARKGAKKSPAPPNPGHYDSGRAVYLNFMRYMIIFAQKFRKPILFCHQPCLVASSKQLHENEAMFMDYLRRRFLTETHLRYFQEKYHTQIDQQLDLCGREDVPVLDSRPVIDALGADEDVFFDNVHMNSNGNRAIANAMHDIVRGWSNAVTA
jgi:lysophospholipase L1-like esterase